MKTYITYALHLPKESDTAVKSNRKLYFHYLLDLDAQGNIVGGQYQRDSGRIDMLWAPLQIAEGPGWKSRRHPHLDKNEVLSIWRDSVEPD